MIIKCPNCHGDLEIGPELAGQSVSCPLCQHVFTVQVPASSVPRPAASRTMPRKPLKLRRRGGFGKFLLLVLFLMLGAFIYAKVHLGESPQQLWNRLVEMVFPPPAPAPPPTPTPTPTPTPEPSPSPTPTPPPVAEATPTHVDPLSWILEHKNYWPKEVTLLEATKFPVVFNGKVAGSAVVPAGSKLGVISIESGFVTASFSGGSERLAMAVTDLHERAAAAMQKAGGDEIAAAAATAAAPAEKDAAKGGDEPSKVEDLAEAQKTGTFVHPGMLHNEEDFKRMRASIDREPWKSGWERLLASRHASLDYKPNPQEKVVRGRDRLATEPENYGILYRDIASAYACALRWRVSGERDYAEKAIEIMNAWSATLKTLSGSTDVRLAAGIYGYEFANAAEIMRAYKGWKPEDFERFKKMMAGVFLPLNKDFLEKHNGTIDEHYWANWDLCNMASMMAIAILLDDRASYNYVIRYFKHGNGNGSIKHAVYHVHPGNLGQWQEAGRDQGHATLGVPLMATICEMAWKQGDDLYGYDNNRFLAGCEYIAKYNLGEDVPFKTYVNRKHGTHTQISDAGRGSMRPGWELVYNHYVVRKGLDAPYTTQMAEKIRPEGGGGDYGPNSGGYDQLGYGTLTATLDKSEKGGSK